MLEKGIGSIECPPELAADYTRRVDEAHAKMIWTHPGMTNWYRNAAGRVVSVLPWRIVDYRRMTLDPSVDEFLVRPNTVDEGVGPATAVNAVPRHRRV
jgi:4-hydroxyacetophenone monooxygenase